MSTWRYLGAFLGGMALERTGAWVRGLIDEAVEEHFAAERGSKGGSVMTPLQNGSPGLAMPRRGRPPKTAPAAAAAAAVKAVDEAQRARNLQNLEKARAARRGRRPAGGEGELAGAE